MRVTHDHRSGIKGIYWKRRRPHPARISLLRPVSLISPYAQKDVFSALSLSSVPFASGSLSVDGIQLTPGRFPLGERAEAPLGAPHPPPAREPAPVCIKRS